LHRQPSDLTLNQQRNFIHEKVKNEGYRFRLASGLPALVRQLDCKAAAGTARKLLRNGEFNRKTLWMFDEVRVTAKKERFSLIICRGFNEMTCLRGWDIVQMLQKPLNLKHLERRLVAVVYHNRYEAITWRMSRTALVLMKAAALGTTPQAAALLIAEENKKRCKHEPYPR
jgi:hypothetical protein